MKLYKIKVKQSVSGRLGDYEFNFVPGEQSAPLEVALDMVTHGLAEEIDELPELKIDPVEDSGEDTSDLPEDFPMRELLIEHELETILKVKAFGDLTEIKGIGPATATEIANVLLDLE